MPNWVKNKVAVSGDEKTIREFKEFVELRSEDSKLEVVENPFCFNRIIPRPELEGDGWYYWDIENWGTKWDSCGTELVIDTPRSLEYEFDTAWSMPEGVFKKLAEVFPTLELSGEYADEDIGYNCGWWFAGNGRITRCEPAVDPFDYACEIWGLDPEEERRWREGE